jgi:hypothetical protein
VEKSVYFSSAPAIAEVSRTGLVKGLAPGEAKITAVLSLGEAVLTSTMLVTVYDPGAPGKVYDLVASITRFDPAWGDLTGYSYTGVVTLQRDPRQRRGLVGKFEDLRLRGPDNTFVYDGYDGPVMSSIDFSGRLVIELRHFTLVVATPTGDILPSPIIEGTFASGGFDSGKFTARRR